MVGALSGEYVHLLESCVFLRLSKLKTPLTYTDAVNHVRWLKCEMRHKPGDGITLLLIERKRITSKAKKKSERQVDFKDTTDFTSIDFMASFHPLSTPLIMGLDSF